MSATAPGAAVRSDSRKLATLPQDVELWVGGPHADAVIASAGNRGRRVDGLDAVIPMLVSHGR
jgi:hypothetical protein